ncbi:MAG: hypothetical protein WD801_07625 [Gemmatimonadaceae bacterium]
MTRSFRLWMAVAAIFLVTNVAGAVYALVMVEQRHALLHLLLVVPGVYWVARLARKRRAVRDQLAAPDDIDARLQRIEQAVDAVAIEVERVGEGQRFMTRTLTEDTAGEPARRE